VSPANPGYTANELAFQLKDCDAKALVTQKALLPVALEAAKQAGVPEDRIILIGDERDESVRYKHFQSIRNAAGTNRYRRTKLDPKKDLAFLVYSSGTTGHPKGVMLSHTNIVSNIMMLAAGEGPNVSCDGGPNGQGDSILAFLPFYHIYGEFNQISSKTAFLTDSRSHVSHSSKYIQRTEACSHVQIRPREILSHNTGAEDYIFLCCSSGRAPTWKAPSGGEIRPQLSPNVKLWSCALDARAGRSRI